MSSLYELTSEWMALMEMAEDPEIDEQAFNDTLEGIEGEIEVKADGYAKVIAQLEYDAEACSKEAERLETKKKHIKNKIDRLKQSLQGAMELTGKTKFKTDLFSFNVRNNAPSVVVDALDVKDIPEKYLKYASPTVNKTALKDDLKAGIELDGIAHLHQTRSLIIK